MASSVKEQKSTSRVETDGTKRHLCVPRLLWVHLPRNTLARILRRASCGTISYVRFPLHGRQSCTLHLQGQYHACILPISQQPTRRYGYRILHTNCWWINHMRFGNFSCSWSTGYHQTRQACQVVQHVAFRSLMLGWDTILREERSQGAAGGASSDDQYVGFYDGAHLCEFVLTRVLNWYQHVQELWGSYRSEKENRTSIKGKKNQARRGRREASIWLTKLRAWQRLCRFRRWLHMLTRGRSGGRDEGLTKIQGARFNYLLWLELGQKMNKSTWIHWQNLFVIGWW